jgi:hypothetical protein
MFAFPRTGLGADVQRARAALPVLPRGFAGHRFSSPARSCCHGPVRRSRLLRRSGCEGWIGEGGSQITIHAAQFRMAACKFCLAFRKIGAAGSSPFHYLMEWLTRFADHLQIIFLEKAVILTNSNGRMSKPRKHEAT